MVVHEVYGLLRDGMAPAVVAEDLVRESNRSVALQVSCTLAPAHRSLIHLFFADVFTHHHTYTYIPPE